MTLLFSSYIIDPIVTLNVTTTNNPTIYQPLILQCVATIMGGNISTVDIIWTTGNTQVRRANNITSSSYINSIFAYNDSLTIPLLNISTIGSEYQCEVLPTRTKTHFLIPIPGS